MLATAIIAAVLAVILSLRIGVDFSYSPEGVSLSAKIGGIRRQILPLGPAGDKKKKQRPAKDKLPEPEKDEETTTGEKEPFLKKGELCELISMGLRTLGKFRRALTVERLEVHYTVASRDPADAAIHYGRVNAVIGAGLPVLERVITIKKREIITDIDFCAEKAAITGRLVIVTRIGSILGIGLAFAASFLNMRYRNR